MIRLLAEIRGIDVSEIDWKKAGIATALGLSVLGGIDNPDVIAQLDRPAQVQTQEENIVAKVIAGEAAGEGYDGMYAVGCVIQTRCGGKDRMYYDPINIVEKPKQFSAYDDEALMKRNYTGKSKQDADEISSKIGTLKDTTGGATNYVTNTLYDKKKNDAESWISRMRITKVIGNHTFLKEK